MLDVITGAGEVGTAMGNVLMDAGHTVLFEDPGRGMSVAPGIKEDLVLHICHPYSEDFIKQTKEYIKRFKPKLTIIHSTVKVGTTEQIGRDVVVSFVRGRHTEGIDKTVLIHHKPLACQNIKKAYEASGYLVNAGFNVSKVYNDPRVIELQKLLDTTYYGVCIAYTKMAKNIADMYGVDWENVAQGNKEYNEGSLAVGHPEWVRPELEPIPGPIAGHCIIPNVKILQQDCGHKLLDSIVEAE